MKVKNFISAQLSRLFIRTSGAMGTVRASRSAAKAEKKAMEPSPVAKRVMPEQLKIFS